MQGLQHAGLGVVFRVPGLRCTTCPENPISLKEYTLNHNIKAPII